EGVADVGAAGVVRSAAGRSAEHAAREAALRAAAVLAAEAAGPCPFDTPGIAQHVAWRAAHQGAWQAATRALGAVLRGLSGPPFGPARVAPACLAWDAAVVPAIARGIDDERAFERMPILADALEEAGCDSPDLVGHCRGPGPHWRGCWVVDLLLGR